jgi:hypothetical protein
MPACGSPWWPAHHGRFLLKTPAGARSSLRRPFFSVSQMPGDVAVHAQSGARKNCRNVDAAPSVAGGRLLSWPRPAAVLRVAPVAGCSITNPKVLRNEYRR